MTGNTQPFARPMVQPWVRVFRFLLALLILSAVVVIWLPAIGQGNPFTLFNYFTIQSNLMAAIVLLWNAIRPPTENNLLRRDLFRGAAVLYLAITGVVYALLLSGYNAQMQGAMAGANLVLHYVAPLAVFADWLIVPPSAALTFRRALVWTAYPLLYLVFSLVRGALFDWYPYGFLDPGLVGGYGGVAIFSAVVLGGALGFIWLLVAIGRWRGQGQTDLLDAQGR